MPTVNANRLTATPTVFSPAVRERAAIPLLNAAPTLFSHGVGQSTIPAGTSPAPYVVKSVNLTGGDVQTLASAQPESITWTLNEPTEATISFPKRAYGEDDIPTLGSTSEVRKLHVYRDGDLMFSGLNIQPDTAGGRGDAQVHCADLLWALNRLNIDAPRDNRLVNGDFEDDLDNWSNTGVTATITTARKVLGTKSVALSTSTAGGETFISQDCTVGPNGVGILLTVVGWFWLDNCAAAALESRGLYVEGRRNGVFQKNNYYAIDPATTEHEWTRAEIVLRVPPNQRYDINVRLYCPQGAIHWDAISVVEMDSFGSGNVDPENEVDIAVIAGALVQFVQQSEHGKFDLHVGTHTPANGAKLVRQYQFAEHIALDEAVGEFVGRDDGIDIGIESTPTTERFCTYSPKGTDRSATVTLEYGDNVADYRWTRDGAGTVTRATEQGEGDGPDREEGEYADTTQVGGLVLQETRQAPSGTVINSLLPRARDRVKKRRKPPLLLELDIRPSANLIHTLKTGDRVDVVVDDGYTQVSGTHRIVKLVLTCKTNVLTAFVNEELD